MIQNDSDLIIDFEFDSIQIVGLIVEIESEFNILLEDEDMNLNILGKFSNLAAMIEKRTSEN